MIEGFLFDRIYVDGTRVAIDHRVQPAAPVFAYPAGAAFTIGDDAAVWAEIALDVSAGVGNVAVRDG
jgi:hypothetical protein